jgi:predicted ATPase
MMGLWNVYHARMESQRARDLGERLITISEGLQDAALLLRAHIALGETLFHLGEFLAARTHLEQGGMLSGAEKNHARSAQDSEVGGLSYLAWTLWHLGYPDQGMHRSQEALGLARERSHPNSLAQALGLAAALHQYRREEQVSQERAEATITVSTEQGLPFWVAAGMFYRGWGLAEQGQSGAGVAQMRQGLDAWRATGAVFYQTSHLALLAEAYGNVEQADEGLHLLAEALALVDKTGERFYEAELHRLKGELLKLSSDNQAEAESCFHHALDIARNQQAKSLELRAVTSLACLWQQQGKRDKARQLLAEIYGWFTEGFDTLDLKEAKALLDELG